MARREIYLSDALYMACTQRASAAGLKTGAWFEWVLRRAIEAGLDAPLMGAQPQVRDAVQHTHGTGGHPQYIETEYPDDPLN